MAADLHMHSTFSDGMYTAEQLVERGVQKGLLHMAITDHDTAKSVHFSSTYQLTEAINLIPACEVSAFDYERGRRVHLLYYYPVFLQKHLNFFEEMAKRRNYSANEAAERISKQFPDYQHSEVLKKHAKDSEVVYKIHMIKQLLILGYTDHYYSDLYRQLFGRKEGNCLVPIVYEDVWSVLKLFKSSNAVTILAHPSVYNSIDIAKEMIQKGVIDGVEVEHPRNKKEDKKILRKLAKEHGLLTTGGTDYHGFAPRAFGMCTATEKEIAALQKISQKRTNNNCVLLNDVI